MEKMIQNLKRSAKRAGLVGLMALGLGGCASLKPSTQPSVDNAMEVLGTRSFSMIEPIHGYTTLRSEMSTLRNLAGMYAGTYEVKRTETGFSGNGYYSEISQPESMLRILKEADVNSDKIITPKEVNDLKNKIYGNIK